VIVQGQKSMTRNVIDFNKPGVKIVTYGNMKGLEFDVVLLPLFDKIPAKDGDIVDSNRAYVAVSRPLSELYLFYWNIYSSPGKIDTMTALANHKELLEWK